MVVSANVKFSLQQLKNSTNKVEKKLISFNLTTGRLWMVLVAMHLLIICTESEVVVSNHEVERTTKPTSEIYSESADVEDHHTETSNINFIMLNQTQSGILSNSKTSKSIFVRSKQNYHSLHFKEVLVDKTSVPSSTTPTESTISSFSDYSKTLLRGQYIQEENLKDENEKTTSPMTDSTIHHTSFSNQDYDLSTQNIVEPDSTNVENSEYSSQFGQVLDIITHHKTDTTNSKVEITTTPYMLHSIHEGDMKSQHELPIPNNKENEPRTEEGVDYAETQDSYKSKNSVEKNESEKTTPPYEYTSSNEVQLQINNTLRTISTSSTNIAIKQTTQYSSLQDHTVNSNQTSVQNSSINDNNGDFSSKYSSQQEIFQSTAVNVATTQISLGQQINVNLKRNNILSTLNSSKDYDPKQFIFKHVSNLTLSQRNKSVICIIFISNIDIVEWFHTYDTPFRNKIATFLSNIKESTQHIEPIDVIYIAPTPTKDEEYFCVSFVVRSSFSKNVYEPAESIGSVINRNLAQFADMLNHPIVAVKTGSRCNFRNIPKQPKWFIHCLSGSIVLVTIFGIMATCLQKLKQHRRVEFENEPKIQVWGSKMHHRAGRYRSGPLFAAYSPQMSVDLLEPTTSSTQQPESPKETHKHKNTENAQIHAYENHFESEDTKL